MEVGTDKYTNLSKEPNGRNIGLPTSLSLTESETNMNIGFPVEISNNGRGICSSPETSGASTPLDGSMMENGFSSCEEEPDENELQSDEFIKKYVTFLFDTAWDISYEDKAKFGELMKNASARMSFAKYVDAHRSHVKCVDESTFYKLLHSFALVLFECGEADDYLPGKTLMNMAFTYYYIPEQKSVCADDTSSSESMSSLSSNNEKKMSRPKARSESDTSKVSLMQRFKQEVEACKQVFQETPSFQELKQGIWRPRKASKSENEPKRRTSSETQLARCSFPASHPDVHSPTKKNFLYEHLKNQVIWKSLRFWNAAFFTAVHAERRRRCSLNDWSSQSPDERDSTNLAIVNITFGQLGTFINNMKCLGLSNETCHEFLRKQSVIGGIPEGGQYYEMLVEQIEDDYTF